MKRNVPAGVENHPAFRGFNTGCCGRLVGHMAWVTVFVSDPESHWNAASEMRYKESEEKAIRFLMDSGGTAAGLHIKERAHYRVSLPFQEKRSEYKHTVSEAVLKMGYLSFEDMRASLRQTFFGVEHVAVFFVFNKKDRSFASVSNGHKSILSTRRSYVATDEFGVIYAGSRVYLPFVICHELLHLYGAMDYYYPDTVKREAEKHFLHSIMLDFGGVIHVDEFTKFLVGWNDDLTPDAIDFLKKTIVTRRSVSLDSITIHKPLKRRTVLEIAGKGDQHVDH